jgi:hypothetical protein
MAVAEYQLNMSSFISDVESVISSFKTVSSKVYDLDGGVGSLEGALGGLSARIQLEEEKLEAAVAVQEQSADFLDLAIQVDKQVASLVDRNKDEFYETNPWLKPAAGADETAWYEDCWNWLCGAGEAIAEGAEQVWDWTKDTAKKAWDGLVDFYQENKKVIDTVLVVVGAIAAIAAVVASGGGALIPLLTALGCSAGAAAAISGAVAVVAVVSTVGATVLNVVDIWAEIENPTFQAWKKGLNIVSGVSNLLYSIGGMYNSFKKITPAQTKDAMRNAFTRDRGRELYGYEYNYLSDFQPGADSAINRELISNKSHNHFYAVDNPNGGKIIVSADPCNDMGVANLVNNTTDEYIVLSGTHGNEIGGLSFDGVGPKNPLNFYKQDCASFQNFPNVKVINIQDHVVSLGEYGRIVECNRPYLQSLFSSGKNIICAWCYSDRCVLVQELLGLI